MKKEEIARSIQYGEPEEATEAVTAIIEEAAKKKSSEEDQRRTAPWLKPGETDNITERNRMMDLITAKNRMENARSAAEQGRPDGIRKHFLFRFPKIAQSPELYDEVVETVNDLQRRGAPNEWETYENAARAVLVDHGEPDEMLTEDKLLELEQKYFAPSDEAPKPVEPVPGPIRDGVGPKQQRGRMQAVAEIKAMRGQPLD